MSRFVEGTQQQFYKLTLFPICEEGGCFLNRLCDDGNCRGQYYKRSTAISCYDSRVVLYRL